MSAFEQSHNFTTRGREIQPAQKTAICVICGEETPLDYLTERGDCESCRDKHDDERAEIIKAMRLTETGAVN